MGTSPYKGRLRIRVNGLLVKNDSLLMIKLRSPVSGQSVWMPPGGGLEFGETMETGLKREFFEETGLQVNVGPLRHINELLEPPFHAVEFYFEVTSPQDNPPDIGRDPEHEYEDQLIEDLQYIPFEDFGKKPVTPEYLSNQFLKDLNAEKNDISFAAHSS